MLYDFTYEIIMNSTHRKFIISGRPLDKSNILESIRAWQVFLNTYFGEGKITHVFTSVLQRTPLYGGRFNTSQESLSYEQVDLLNSKGIGLMLTLTNHYFSEDAYSLTRPILERLENDLNCLIIVNDDFARQVRKDFPSFHIKASVIKNIRTLGQIHQAMELYDCVTLAPNLNDNEELLRKIDCKNKILLFANAGCLYRCPGPTCYKMLSKTIFYNESAKGKTFCLNKGNMKIKRSTVFPLNADKFKGYDLFKVIPMPWSLFLPQEKNSFGSNDGQ